MNAIRSRFLKAIEAKKISYREISKSIDEPLTFLYDLGAHDRDWFAVASIQNIVDISSVLDVSPAWLAAGDEPDKYMGRLEFSQFIEEYIRNLTGSLDEFETEVGWKVVEIIEDPDVFMEWSLDCLISLCKKVGLDWRTVLPK